MTKSKYVPPVMRKKYGPQERHTLVFDPASHKTKQSFRDETNINSIMAKYLRTGYLPESGIPPQYADISDLPASYSDALNLIQSAEDSFAELPSRARRHFNNDPAQFLAAVSDPNRHAELIKLGLMEVAGKDPVTPGSEPDPAPPSGGENPQNSPPS